METTLKWNLKSRFQTFLCPWILSAGLCTIGVLGSSTTGLRIKANFCCCLWIIFNTNFIEREKMLFYNIDHLAGNLRLRQENYNSCKIISLSVLMVLDWRLLVSGQHLVSETEKALFEIYFCPRTCNWRKEREGEGSVLTSRSVRSGQLKHYGQHKTIESHFSKIPDLLIIN